MENSSNSHKLTKKSDSGLERLQMVRKKLISWNKQQRSWKMKTIARPFCRLLINILLISFFMGLLVSDYQVYILL